MWGDQGLPDVLPVGYGEPEAPANYPYPSGVPDRGGPNLRPSSVPGSGGGAGPGWETSGAHGYGAASAPSGPYIDKTDTGGYAYRFYKSGDIVIIATGNAKIMPIGRVLTKKDSAWSSIVSKFGTYEMQAKTQTQSMLQSAVPSVVSAFTAALAPATPAAAAAPTFAPSEYSAGGGVTAPSTGSNLPYWILGGGVLVVGAVVLFSLSRKGD
jgi:hypothetical protein